MRSGHLQDNSKREDSGIEDHSPASPQNIRKRCGKEGTKKSSSGEDRNDLRLLGCCDVELAGWCQLLVYGLLVSIHDILGSL
jgi:hypothetical protein